MEKKYFIEGNFGKICGVLHSVDNMEEVVILVHGFSSSKESSAKINSEILNSIGINAFRIDLDNQGESDLDFKTGVSIPNYVKQVKSSILFLKQKGFKKISLLGTSFGGIICLSTVLDIKDINRIFLRAPVLDWTKLTEERLGDNLLEYKKLGKLPSFDYKGSIRFYFNYDCYTTSKNYSMYQHAQNITQKIMIIHGDKDEVVSEKYALDIIKLFPNATLKIIKGAGHNLGVNGNFLEGVECMKHFFLSK